VSALLPTEVDFAALREAVGDEAMRMLALRADGHTPQEIAERLGVHDRVVRRALEDVEAAALRQANLFPPLAEDELEDLREAARKYGILMPLVRDEHGEIIDGRHRAMVARELGIEPPEITLADLDEREKREVARALNLARRHVSREQRRRLIEAELRGDPARSDRGVAKAVGSSPTTVGAVRRDLVRQGQLSKVDTRRGEDNRVRPVPPRAEVALSTGRAPGRSTVPETAAPRAPTMRLTIDAPVEEVGRWQAAADARELSLAAWARQRLNEAAA